jgi:hypothetical protein
LSNTEDATKEELQNHNLYKQIKNREKDMLQSSRDFLQSMRAHTKVRHRRESAQKILTEVRHLGRIPRALNRIDDRDSRDEFNLARQLSNARAAQIFTVTEEAELDKFAELDAEKLRERKQVASREHAQDLLAQVRRLGRIPKELNTAEDDESKDEHNLARQLRKAHANQIFNESEETELVAIGEAEVKTLIWNAYSADSDTMVELYVAACALLRTGVKLQSSYDAQLLEEIEWRVERERQAKVDEQKAQQRANLDDIKETIRAIHSSELRCACHDFFNWRALWRVDPRVTQHLRDTGHHLPDCPLAQVTSTLARMVGQEPNKFTPTTTLESDQFKVVARDPHHSGYMLVTSCLDQKKSWSFDAVNGIMFDILLERGSTSPYDDGCPELLRGPMGGDSDSEEEPGAPEPGGVDTNQIKSSFVGYGIFSECQRCKSTIEAGIMHYGCRREPRGWSAACQELTFHHFLGSCMTLDPNSEDCEDLFDHYISKTWAEQAVNPQQKIPGSDNGVSELAYWKVLAHCNIQAAYQIDDLYFTETGRLYQRQAPSNPTHVGSLAYRVSQQAENPTLHDYWKELWHKKEKETSEWYNANPDWPAKPDDASEAPEEHDYLPLRPHVPGIKHVNNMLPARAVFRFRTSPFRQEPEWQLDDTDVVQACAKVDVARVRSLGIDFAAEALKLIESLGRWPGLDTDASTGPGQTEARLANVVHLFVRCTLQVSQPV